MRGLLVGVVSTEGVVAAEAGDCGWRNASQENAVLLCVCGCKKMKFERNLILQVNGICSVLHLQCALQIHLSHQGQPNLALSPCSVSVTISPKCSASI